MGCLRAHILGLADCGKRLATFAVRKIKSYRSSLVQE